MRRGYKVVCNTAAGRHRYMNLLIPYVLDNDIVDRYDIWVNTLNPVDLRFFELLAQKYSKIKLVYIEDNKFSGLKSLFEFYKYCTEEDTIYVKLDDDLIWFEPDAITRMVDFRIDNPDYFIVSPLVINNCSGTYLLQNGGKIRLKKYLSPTMTWESAWCSATFAYQLLDWFQKKVRDDSYKELHMGKKPIGMLRFSINMIVWFGATFKDFGGVCPKGENDEEYFSVIKPTQLGVANCINADVLVAHFAFTYQREDLDKTDMLLKYENLIRSKKDKVCSLYEEIKCLTLMAKENVNIEIPHYDDCRSKKNGFREFLRTRRIPGTFYDLGRIYCRLKEHKIEFDDILFSK